MAWKNLKTSIIFFGLAPTLLAQPDPIKTDGSDIGISIMGTIIQTKSDDNVALIKEASGVVVAVKKGFTTPSQFTVLAIHGKYLELKNPAGKIYWLYRDKFAINASSKDGTASSPSPAPNPANFYREEGFERNENVVRMTEVYRDKIVKQDLQRILMEATAEPYFENGSIVGFLISQIDEGSIFQKSGIRDGDIVTRINDQELNSIANSVKLLQSLKGAKQIDVEIKRGGQPQKIKIEIN